MSMEVCIKFPSGKDYTVLGEGTQSLSIEGLDLTYRWKYTAEQLIDKDDPSLGTEESSYEGSRTGLFKFFSGTEVSRNVFHRKWQFKVFFSGMDSVLLLSGKRSDMDDLQELVDEWRSINTIR